MDFGSEILEEILKEVQHLTISDYNELYEEFHKRVGKQIINIGESIVENETEYKSICRMLVNLIFVDC